MKKTILMTMAYTMDKTSLHELRDIFVVLDTEASGTVTLVDLKKALQQVHSDRHMNDETIEKLFHGIDGESDAVVAKYLLEAILTPSLMFTLAHHSISSLCLSFYLSS